MRASVVLPSPGGPESNTWLSASPRRLAAPTITCNRSTVLAWPAKSENESGRSAASAGETGASSVLVMKPSPVGAAAAADLAREDLGSGTA